MADKTLQARILLRYGTFAEWQESQIVLAVGEMAICYFNNNNTILPSDTWPNNTPPAIGLKVGNGSDIFRNLPWVQAVAADVYSWAKESSKPTYSAYEISGLDAYIEEHASGGGSSSSVARQYQIVQGTGNNSNYYYLRYKNDDSNTWITDTNHYIDLSDYAALRAWVGASNISNYGNLRTYIGQSLMLPIIQSLATTDTEIQHGFVTAVSETDGIVSTTKRQPDFEDLSGSATVEQGGTGLTELPENEVLIGNGTNAIRSMQIATAMDDSFSFIPTYLIKAYVDNKTAGLTGAMHWVGDATVPISGPTDPQINDYDFSKAKKGDVITWATQEYVWTGGTWRLLGDEGSYAIKGSIKDADIAADAEISLAKIAGLIELLATKVDKETGKQLSTNDYTNEEKIKLSGIQAGAQKNVIEHIRLNDQEYPPTTVNDVPNTVSLTVKEFDDESRNKLGTIAPGAQVNVIERFYVDGEEQPVSQDKAISITTNPHLDHINKIESIYLNGTKQEPDREKAVRLVINPNDFTVVDGAVVPNGNTTEELSISNKKIQLARIAKTGEIPDLIQPANTYILINCGTSTTVI